MLPHLVLLVVAATAGAEWREETNWADSKWSRQRTVSRRGPQFLPGLPSRVLTTVGNDVTIPCRVSNLKRRTVSWIRQSDLQVLTIDAVTFTSDDRFKVQSSPRSLNSLHKGAQGTWDLRVKEVTMEDSDVYLCQINTRPTLAHAITLEVADGRPRINGPHEVYLHAGSHLLLTCWLMAPPHPPSLIWRVNGTTLNTSVAARGGVSLYDEINEGRSSSRLSIQEVHSGDSGNYTCGHASVLPAQVLVYVLQEKQPAAMHHDSRATSRLNSVISLFLCQTFVVISLAENLQFSFIFSAIHPYLSFKALCHQFVCFLFRRKNSPP